MPSNDDLRKFTVEECGEPLVDLRKECTLIEFSDDPEFGEKVQLDGTLERHLARKTIAEMLNQAQNNLPVGHKLKVIASWRDPKIQVALYDNLKNELTEKHPEWSQERLKSEVEHFVNPVDLAPHCAGAAIDLTVVGSDGNELDMGTKFDGFTKKAYTDSPLITKGQKHNRQILISAMTNAGFANFPAEWWHWSYGDWHWADQNNQNKVLYGPIYPGE